MEKFVITGGKPLHGEVTISGAKNAAVGILPATILAADVCVIENLPDISDVSVSLKILSTLGAQVKMLNRNTYEIDTRHLVTTNVPDDLSRQMRASYYFLGALLSRFGKAQVAMPGGCNLGPRPIDQHLKVFSALSAVMRRFLRKPWAGKIRLTMRSKFPVILTERSADWMSTSI